MTDFSFLKKFIISKEDHTASSQKHCFFELTQDEILGSESRLEIKFPSELKKFYSQIGYGFLCNLDKNRINRLMDPQSVADFRLGQGVYELDSDRELYDEVDKLVFFEASEGVYLTIDIKTVDHPIYYFDKKIAESLEEFITRMDENTDYYIE